VRTTAARTLVMPLFAVALLVVVPLTAQPGVPAQPGGPVEDSIKAAFLYNFAKYVEWPDAAFPGGEFRVCVAADPVFLKSVDDIIAGETIAGRAVTRQTPATPDEARACNILFISRGIGNRVDQLLTAVKGAPVLTVGDSIDFQKRGGIVTFVNDGDRVRFDVNVVGAQMEGLTISSRLLRVARRVTLPGAER